jgi:hypothetical protein
MRCSITLWQFSKRAQITVDGFVIGDRLHFHHFEICMRCPRIACNADLVLQHSWENYCIIKFRNGGWLGLQFCLLSAILKLIKAYLITLP